MTEFIKATYHRDHKVAEFVTKEGRRLLREGGSLCWRLNNCGNMSSPVVNGLPAPKKTQSYIGFAEVSNPEPHFFFIFPDYETGKAELKKSLRRRYGKKTIAETLPQYAPKSDGNDPQHYLDMVTQSTGFSSDATIGDFSEADLNKLVNAIQTMEGYDKDFRTRKETWIDATSLIATNGSQPIPHAEIHIEHKGKSTIIKADKFGQFPTIPHPQGDDYTVIRQQLSNGTSEILKVLTRTTPSGFFLLVSEMIYAKASTMSHAAPAGAESIKPPHEYRVKPSDTLAKIAAQFKTTEDELKKINQLNSHVVYPEQLLWIDGKGISRGHTVPIAQIFHSMSEHKKAKDLSTIPNNVPVVRSKGGKGAPLALVPVSREIAPWMIIAAYEAALWQGKKEEVITKTQNFHRLVTDNDRAGGIESKAGGVKYDGNPTLAGDANAWCASFVNFCLREAGYSPAPTGFMSSHFCHNNPDKFVKISKPVYGAIRYCRRDGGGHVCFVYGTWKGKMLVLGGNQHDTILIEYPDPTSKGVEYFVPIAYQKFAEKEQEKGLQEVDIKAAQLFFGKAIKIGKGDGADYDYS